MKFKPTLHENHLSKRTFIVLCACKKNGASYQNCSETELIEEGKRLVTVFGCNDCHSPKK